MSGKQDGSGYTRPGALEESFRKASPPLRRWGGMFTNTRFLPRRRRNLKPVFGHAKPHGQVD